MKLIRELRFGPPKCWKTGSIVSTYPRPLLVLSTDEGGLNVLKEPIDYLDPTLIETLCSKKTEELKPLSVFDFCHVGSKRVIMEAYQPQGDKLPFQVFIKVCNKLATLGCPWKTVVLDGITGLDEIIKMHNSVLNPGSLGSALKWAMLVGGKITQIIGVLTTLPCHAVIISHASTPEKDEDVTKETHITAVMTSKRLRDICGGLVDNYFYQDKENGKAVVHTTDFGYVKGIGARWPHNLPPRAEPTFQGIYGKEQ